MIEWLIVPGYFGVSYIAYRMMHRYEFKSQFNWYMSEKTRHGCKYAHPAKSHEKWAFDCAVADKDPHDFAAAAIFWPVAAICLGVDFVGRMLSGIPTSRKIEKQVKAAELEYSLQKFAEKEGLPWNRES